MHEDQNEQPVRDSTSYNWSDDEVSRARARYLSLSFSFSPGQVPSELLTRAVAWIRLSRGKRRRIQICLCSRARRYFPSSPSSPLLLPLPRRARNFFPSFLSYLYLQPSSRGFLLTSSPWCTEKKASGKVREKRFFGKKYSRKKASVVKKVLGERIPGKKVFGKKVPGKKLPRKKALMKKGPRKKVSEKAFAVKGMPGKFTNGNWTIFFFISWSHPATPHTPKDTQRSPTRSHAGKSFGLKFIPDQSDLFRFIPKSVPCQSEPIWVNGKKIFNLGWCKSVKNQYVSIRVNPRFLILTKIQSDLIRLDSNQSKRSS